MPAPRVFISMGTPYTDQYSRFRDALEAFLRDQCGADPRIIGKNEYPAGNPLTKIKTVMESCSGVIVVAYERKFVGSGAEKRNSENQQVITEQIYTTPWNHVESAMAYTLGLPIYVICQNGLTQEALIESKLDWYVQYCEINADILKDQRTAASIKTWIDERVTPFSKRSKFWKALQGTLRLSEMTPKEILGALGVLIAAFSLGAAAMKAFPKFFP